MTLDEAKRLAAIGDAFEAPGAIKTSVYYRLYSQIVDARLLIAQAEGRA